MDPKKLERLKTLSLLYVEDDAATRDELAQILEVWLGEVHVAGNGQEGLDAFLRVHPDMVLTDIQMPVLNGLSMSAEIRRRVPDQPVIVLSAYNDMEYLFRAIDIGIANYVTKPVSVERLLGKLSDIADALLAIREQRRDRRLLEQYRMLVDESAIVTKLDPRGRITYVNDKFSELSGYGRQELIGRDIHEIRHAEESQEFSGPIWTGLLNGRKWGGIIKNKARDGSLYVVESSLVPIVNEHDEVEEIVSLDIDITDIYLNYETLVEALSRSEHSLQEQRHFLSEYKRALELGTCICVTDAEGRIISANRQFSSILGYQASELRDQPLGDIAQECDKSCFYDLAREGAGHCNRVVTLSHKSGAEMVFSVVFVAVHNLEGKVDSIILVCQDITESLRLTRALLETQRELLFVMGEVVENRSYDTGQHVKRVAEISNLLALKSGLDPEQAEMIKVSAPMHDIGKVGIPDAILHKPGKLDPEQYEVMKTHAALGFGILKNLDQPLVQLAARIALEHHEHYDGKGYPKGLKGEEISIEGRIVAVADVVDALGHARVYKSAWDDARIRSYFEEQRGRQFDPVLVDLLLNHWDEIVAIRQRYQDS
jgi:PAS domain S-box-containing protein